MWLVTIIFDHQSFMSDFLAALLYILHIVELSIRYRIFQLLMSQKLVTGCYGLNCVPSLQILKLNH